MMASFKQEPSFKQEHREQSLSACSDNLDNFINWDEQNVPVPTPSISPLSSRSKSNSITTPTTTTNSNSNTLILAQSDPQVFAGPSHQYDLYKQQAGLPVGAVANTFALNEADQYGYGRQLSYGVVPPTDGYFGMSSDDDFMNFNTVPSQNAFQDVDMDFGNPTEMNTLTNTFVNPAAIDGQEASRPTQPAQIHTGRVYPGMHQQAALAKAQEQARQQAAIQQQQKSAPSTSHGSRSGSSAKPPSDPIVEESISRLLNQMRHSSVSSPDDDASTPTANSFPHSARSKKDEEDMDEDERLLASEEGKKLSSKERRQLRNKVSARAFRSRRKEYIGQLEGELNTKATECDQLRMKNEELMAENNRLTDLSRMLLSSHHFQDFLADLSGTQSSSVSLQPQQQSFSQAPTPPAQSAAPRKDVNPNQVTARHSKNSVHVGMTMIPEEPSFRYSATESMNSSYTNTGFNSGLYDMQVFAITSVPEGPVVDQPDFSMLHGKESNFVGPSPSEDEAKDEPTMIDSIPAPKVEAPEPIETPVEDTSIEVSEAALALFATLSSPSTTLCDVTPEDRIFGEIELEKAFGRVELVIDRETTEASEEVSSATLERFERLCSRMDSLATRIGAITAHS